MSTASTALPILSATAAAIAFSHTILGPDHYLPFALAGRANAWPLRRTLALTLVSGIGHVLGSVLLGAIGIALGLALSGLEAIEGLRGNLVAWVLLGLGIAYALWGLRRAVRTRPHQHWHAHDDGTLHNHTHQHRSEHLHVHGDVAKVTPWVLFVVFLLGPCEPLIPLLMVPASHAGWWEVAIVATVFGLVTIATMLGAVAACSLGLGRVRLGAWERHAHTVAGVLIALSAAAMLLLGL